jgi:hypothetical protein
VLEFEFDSNSRKFENFELIRSLITVFRVQKTCLDVRDVTIVSEDLADVVDWPLFLIDVHRLLLLHYQGSADDLGGCHDIQEECLARLRQSHDRGAWRWVP